MFFGKPPEVDEHAGALQRGNPTATPCGANLSERDIVLLDHLSVYGGDARAMGDWKTISEWSGRAPEEHSKTGGEVEGGGMNHLSHEAKLLKLVDTT